MASALLPSTIYEERCRCSGLYGGEEGGEETLSACKKKSIPERKKKKQQQIERNQKKKKPYKRGNGYTKLLLFFNRHLNKPLNKSIVSFLLQLFNILHCSSYTCQTNQPFVVVYAYIIVASF